MLIKSYFHMRLSTVNLTSEPNWLKAYLRSYKY